MARKILITSGKGGVGKTTICVNLGNILADKGNKVLLVDADFGLNNLDIVMGVESKVIYDLYDIINGRCRPIQAIISAPDNNNLFILPASKDIKGINLSVNILSNVIKELDANYDYILIDSPAGIEKGFVRTLNITKEAVIVTSPHISSIRDADKIINILRNVGFNELSLVVNRIRGDQLLNKESLSIDFIEEYMGVSIIGCIPEDDEINNQLLLGGQIRPISESYASFNKMSKYFLSGKIDLYDCTKKYRGILGNIRRILRKII